MPVEPADGGPTNCREWPRFDATGTSGASGTTLDLVPDPIFNDPRLAVHYDELDGRRDDLVHYIAIIDELGARHILDVGCGTGSFASLLTRAGRSVVGLDPAHASLSVAQAKPGTEHVRWELGDVAALAQREPDLRVDAATMTGNVAQVFLTDEQWSSTLRSIEQLLHDDGHLIFETRVPERRAWESWTREQTHRHVNLTGGRTVETWVELTEVSPPFVSFRHFYRFGEDEHVTSDSSLRFRTLQEINSTLEQARLALVDVRDAPDRPGLEHVIIARKANQ